MQGTSSGLALKRRLVDRSTGRRGKAAMDLQGKIMHENTFGDGWASCAVENDCRMRQSEYRP
jgi:hypothetical protein